MENNQKESLFDFVNRLKAYDKGSSGRHLDFNFCSTFSRYFSGFKRYNGQWISGEIIDIEPFSSFIAEEDHQLFTVKGMGNQCGKWQIIIDLDELNSLINHYNEKIIDVWHKNKVLLGDTSASNIMGFQCEQKTAILDCFKHPDLEINKDYCDHDNECDCDDYIFVFFTKNEKFATILDDVLIFIDEEALPKHILENKQGFIKRECIRFVPT